MLYQERAENSLTLNVTDFSLDATFDCGQCFRWKQLDDGSYRGVAMGRQIRVRQENDRLTIYGASRTEFETVWRHYFDLDRDYALLKKEMSRDPVLKKAVEYAPGIRILRQEPWEALCSFIISQNNNIPRIRGIIGRLCVCFGKRLGDGVYAFPEASDLCGLTVEDLAPLRSGFRAGYILDAARKVASGEIVLDSLEFMTLDQARAELLKIRGVGPKVADCALLFGCGKADAFPVDVWIKRVLSTFYPGGFPSYLEHCRGIAQQYLFHYARCCPDCVLCAAGRA